MTRKPFYLLSLLLLSPLAAEARNSQSPCYTVYECYLHGAVGAEAVLLKPCSQDFITGFRIDTTGAGLDTVRGQEYFAISPDYDWGFRAFATLADMCETKAVEFSWLYLHATNSTRLKNLPNSIPTIESIWSSLFNGFRVSTNSLDMSVKYLYNNGRLRGLYSCCSGNAFQFQVYAGGRYVYIKRTDVGQGLSPTGVRLINRMRAETNAGGIDVGLRLCYSFCGGFYLKGESGVGGFVGSNKLHIQSSLEIGTFRSNLSNSHCFTGVDAKLAIGYRAKCGSFDLQLEIGYQTEYYFSPLRTAVITSPAAAGVPGAQTTPIEDINVGFNGFVLGGSIGF